MLSEFTRYIVRRTTRLSSPVILLDDQAVGIALLVEENSLLDATSLRDVFVPSMPSTGKEENIKTRTLNLIFAWYLETTTLDNESLIFGDEIRHPSL